MSRPRCSIVICLAITAVMLLSASQDPPQAGTGPQEAEVVAVVIDQRTQSPVVLLRGKRSLAQKIVYDALGSAA